MAVTGGGQRRLARYRRLFTLRNRPILMNLSRGIKTRTPLYWSKNISPDLDDSQKWCIWPSDPWQFTDPRQNDMSDTNFSTLLPNVTALWINGVSLNSLAHTFFYRTHRPNKKIAVIISNNRKYWKVHIRKQQHLILPVNSKKRQLMRTKTAVSNSSEGSFQWWR